jgi:hypothetical protein
MKGGKGFAMVLALLAMALAGGVLALLGALVTQQLHHADQDLLRATADSVHAGGVVWARSHWPGDRPVEPGVRELPTGDWGATKVRLTVVYRAGEDGLEAEVTTRCLRRGRVVRRRALLSKGADR